MSTVEQMNTQPVVNTEVLPKELTKSKPLAPKYKNYTKFALWFMKKLQNNGDIEAIHMDAAVKGLGIYLATNEEKQILFDSFESDSKEMDKEIKQMVKLHNKPPAKPRKPKKVKALETDVESQKPVDEIPNVEATNVEVPNVEVPNVETSAEPVVEVLSVETPKEAPVKKERKKSKKNIIVEGDDIVAQIVEAANNAPLDEPSTSNAPAKKEKKTRKKAASTKTVVVESSGDVSEDRKESLEQLDETENPVSPPIKKKIVRKPKQGNETPVLEESNTDNEESNSDKEEPILTKEQMDVLGELEMESYD